MASLLYRTFLNQTQAIFQLKPVLIIRVCNATRKARMIDPKPAYPKNVAIDKGAPIAIDTSLPQLHFEKSEKLQKVSETVRKILSLEYATRNEFRLFEENFIKDMFKKDETEENSIEIQIALHTIKIRRLEKYIKETPQDKKARFHMYRAVYRRENFLLELMNKDYERFEWIKEKLDLQWTPPQLSDERRSSKYGLFKMETKEKARQERKAKLEALQKVYNIERVKFFEKKEKMLKEIDNEIKELGFTDFNLDSIKTSKQI